MVHLFGRAVSLEQFLHGPVYFLVTVPRLGLLADRLVVLTLPMATKQKPITVNITADDESLPSETAKEPNESPPSNARIPFSIFA